VAFKVQNDSSQMNAYQSTAVPAANALPGLMQGPHGEPSLLLQLALARGPLRVAVVHPCDSPSLAALSAACGAGLIDPLIVGPRERIKTLASAARIELSGIEIDDVPHSHAAAARAVQLAAHAEVRALMKGSLHTDELMGAVVDAQSGLRTGKRISHCFLVQLPSYARPFIMTDAAINVTPDLEQKRGIVQNAIDLAHALGLALPRVAILSAVETVNPQMRSTLDAAALSKMADRGQLSGALVDGPLAFDNAISVRAARLKGIASPVAGRADILVVPDLEAGNMLVKQLEFLSGAASAGIVIGAKVPIVLTSRADSVSARIASCALAALLAPRDEREDGSGRLRSA